MVLDLATSLHNKGYTDITMVVGSDRVREFENILKKYNGERNRHGFYNFKSIKVASAGERDPDAEGATGMSASKMRAAAEKGDIDSFKKGLPRGISNKEIEDLFVSVRSGMGLSKKLAASYGSLAHVSGAKPIASLEEFEQKQIRDSGGYAEDCGGGPRRGAADISDRNRGSYATDDTASFFAKGGIVDILDIYY